MRQQLINHAFNGDAFGFGTIVHQDAMPQHRLGQGANIVESDMRAPFQQRPHFAP